MLLLLFQSVSALPRPDTLNLESTELVGRAASAIRCSMLDLDDAQSRKHTFTLLKTV